MNGTNALFRTVGNGDTMMRKFTLALVSASMMLALAGCGYSPGERAVTGGALGAGAGAGIAAVTGGRPLTGALIGGGVGAAGGALTAP
jgi:osmotically inducible lipoprotein OsmB